VAVLTPIAIAAFMQARTALWRNLVLGMLVLSAIPIAISLNRGLWLGLAVGFVFISLRLARQKDRRALGLTAATAAGIGALLLVTPLGGLVTQRVESSSNSNETRLSVYREAIDGVKASPLLGKGAPRPSASTRDLPPVGTQSQFFQILYSHGIPGAFFFVGWFLYTLWSTRKPVTRSQTLVQSSLLVFVVALPYYNFLPITLHVVAVVAAMLWRTTLEPASPEAEELGFTQPRGALGTA
jgi:O-antigen ligase